MDTFEELLGEYWALAYDEGTGISHGDAANEVLHKLRQAAIAHAVPENCVVVPKEPTEDMVMAGWAVEELVTPDRTWEAMIAAAPKGETK